MTKDSTLEKYSDELAGMGSLFIKSSDRFSIARDDEAHFTSSDSHKRLLQGTSHTTVTISGSHFYQSPIGAGGTVDQVVTYDKQQDLADLQRLVEAFESHLGDLGLDPAANRKAAAQVATLRAQLQDEPDPVIVKQAGRSLRAITENTIANIIATTATKPAVWDWVQQAMANLFG